MRSPFYAEDAAFNESARRSTAQLQPLMSWGTDRGYFPNLANSLFIADRPEDEDAARQDFMRVSLNINYLDGSQYLGTYLRTREELE